MLGLVCHKVVGVELVPLFFWLLYCVLEVSKYDDVCFGVGFDFCLESLLEVIMKLFWCVGLFAGRCGVPSLMCIYGCYYDGAVPFVDMKGMYLCASLL